MLLQGLLLLPAAVLVQQAVAQAIVNATSIYYAPGIPRDTPVEGDYTDFLRPRLHFSPPRYFMNGRSDRRSPLVKRLTRGRPQWHAQRPNWPLSSVLPIQSTDTRGWQPALGTRDIEGPVHLGEPEDCYLSPKQLHC